MGSCGSWDANVTHIKKIDVRQSKENTPERIQAFINKHQNRLVVNKDYNELKKGDILLAVTIYDEDDEEIGEVVLSEIGAENIDAKKFIDKEMYDKLDGFDYDDDYYTEPEFWVYRIEVKDVESKLKFLDLDKIEKNIHMWKLAEPNYLHKEALLADCSDYIYCNNDNSATDEFKVTQKFIDSLSVGDVIRLYGNGDGEHC